MPASVSEACRPRMRVRNLSSLGAADTEPEQVNLLRECRRVGEHAIEVFLRIHLAIVEHAAGATEAADVREQVEIVERHVKCLESAHGQTGHRAMVAISERSVGLVDERNQREFHVVLERLRHFLARTRRFRRGPGHRVGNWLPRAARIAVRHHDDHGLAFLGGDAVVEDDVRAPLADPAGFVFAAAVLQVEHRVARLRIRVVIRR